MVEISENEQISLFRFASRLRYCLLALRGPAG